MEKIELDDMWCAIKHMKYSIRSPRKQTCIDCRKVLKGDEDIIMLINNYIFFPNCLIHKSCIENMGGINTGLKTLKLRFEESKKLSKQAEKLWPK